MKKLFEEWVKDKFLIRNGYYVSVKDIKDGWVENDLTHYSDKYVLGRYNKYLEYTNKK